MEKSLNISLLAESLSVYPKDDKTTIFQLGLVITNSGPEDIVPLKSEMGVRSSFNWFSKPLHQFNVVCDAGFCVLRESTLHEIFHFSLHQEVSENEQKAFYEIINETKDLHEALKFDTINFQLSDGSFLTSSVHLVHSGSGNKDRALGKN